MPLTDATVKNAKPTDKQQKLFDGGGLFLLVTPKGGKWWRLKFRVNGKEKGLSLGVYPDVSLKEARDRRDAARKSIAAGRDPAEARKADKAAKDHTFEAIAGEWLDKQRHKMAAGTLRKTEWIFDDLLFPYIGGKPIASIDPADLLVALKKIEDRGHHETAHRAKGRASQVFDYAISTGRAKYNPAQSLSKALAPVKSTRRAAITDPAKIGELLRALDSYTGHTTTLFALRLAPHVFVRPGELRAARWEEFELLGEEPTWRIPAARMKMKDEHIVPLSTQAVALLNELAAHTGPKGLLFPSLRSPIRPISNNTINAALRRMDYDKDEMTGHGFKAMASTCLNEKGFAPDVIELQLAHRERNKVRAAYNRAQRLEERRKMMQAWSDYLDGLKANGSKVVNINKRKSA